jgi:hypothetical protein
MSGLQGYVDEVDVQVEKISRLIDGAVRKDPELAAGLATTESLLLVQKKIDRTAAAAETLDQHVRDARKAAARARASSGG